MFVTLVPAKKKFVRSRSEKIEVQICKTLSLSISLSISISLCRRAYIRRRWWDLPRLSVQSALVQHASRGVGDVRFVQRCVSAAPSLRSPRVSGRSIGGCTGASTAHRPHTVRDENCPPADAFPPESSTTSRTRHEVSQRHLCRPLSGSAKNKHPVLRNATGNLKQTPHAEIPYNHLRRALCSVSS